MRRIFTFHIHALGWFLLCIGLAPCYAADSPSDSATETSPKDWHHGLYLDLNYAVNFNFPENHQWRSRTTTPRNNELAPNMGLAYLRKDLSADSRWGFEVLAQAGYDTEAYAFGNDHPPLTGADTLRHFGRANASYLVPVGKGLTVQAGLFNSLIGYESLYARDNANYTRSWIADNSPYQMFGVNARYPIRDDFSIALFVINGYWHLANPNSLPSYGAQGAWKPSSRMTLTQTLYYGPDQRDIDLKFWRLFSDTIVEWKDGTVVAAFEYQVGTENLAVPGSPRTFWMGASAPVRWTIRHPWSLAIRPEFFWDRNGRQTGVEQTVAAITSTVEYAIGYEKTAMLIRLEHRFDESTGAGGGFFKRGDVGPGLSGLTGSQHLLLLSVLLSFDS